MNITHIGPWVLLGTGVVVVAVSLYVVVAQKRTPVVLLVFGALFAGVGIHGPLFMGPYAEFLRAFASMTGTPGPESYQEVFKRIGEGGFDPELQQLALTWAMENPVEDMETILDGAIDSATNDAGRDTLMSAREAIEGKRIVADQLARQAVISPESAAAISDFDPATRTAVSNELLTRSPEQLRQLQGVNPGQLEEWAGRGARRGAP